MYFCYHLLTVVCFLLLWLWLWELFPLFLFLQQRQPALEMTNPMGLSSGMQGTTAARALRDIMPALAQVFQDAEVTFTHKNPQQQAWRCELSQYTSVGLHRPSSRSSKGQTQLHSLCWMNQWFLSQDCQKQAGAKECRCWHSGSWTGSTVSFSKSLHSCQTEQLWPLPSWEKNGARQPHKSVCIL